MDNSDIGGTVAGLLLVLLIFAIIFVPVVKIIRKAGYSGWWVLMWFVPIANIVMLWVFAFSDWPSLEKRPG
jgi:Na+/melibiose symporter-like transporter